MSWRERCSPSPHPTYPWLSRRLLEQPELLDRLSEFPEWKKIILQIVTVHAASNPPPKLPTWHVAFLVDMEMLFGRSLSEARAAVAKDIAETGVSEKAVALAHGKYGKQGVRRRKP